MALAGGLLTALILVARHRGLVVPTTSSPVVQKALWRSGTMLAVFASSIPVAIVTPKAAPYTWMAIIPLRLVGSRARR